MAAFRREFPRAVADSGPEGKNTKELENKRKEGRKPADPGYFLPGCKRDLFPLQPKQTRPKWRDERRKVFSGP